MRSRITNHNNWTKVLQFEWPCTKLLIQYTNKSTLTYNFLNKHKKFFENEMLNWNSEFWRSTQVTSSIGAFKLKSFLVFYNSSSPPVSRSIEVKYYIWKWTLSTFHLISGILDLLVFGTLLLLKLLLSKLRFFIKKIVKLMSW